MCNIGLFASSLEWSPTMCKGVIKNPHNPWLLMEYPGIIKYYVHIWPLGVTKVTASTQQVPLVL